MTFGLHASELEAIRATLAQHGGVQRVWVFSSRAMGRERPGSDVDLAIEGPSLTYRDVLAISAELEDLGLLLTFDVMLLHELEDDDEPLRQHIARVGQVLYAKPGIEAAA